MSVSDMPRACLGTARIDITPDAPMHTIGFGLTEPSKGVLRPLAARVAVWRYGGETSAIASIDHIGYAVSHANRLREAIGREIGANAERVMLCFSHTHCAPNDSVEAEYAAMCDERILEGARRALAALRPVLAGWGNAYADIGVNRRAGADALDRRVGILKVVDAESGAPALLLLRVTAHNNCLKRDTPYISPDFFGAAREMLEERFGCPALITQGASGNIAPKYFQSALNPPDANDPTRFIRSKSACEDMARKLFFAAEPVIGGIEPREITRLWAYANRIRLYSSVPDWERAVSVGEEARRETGANPQAWLQEVRRLLDAGIKAQWDDAEIQYFRVNEGCVCGVPNELMCEFALRASAALSDDRFYLGGYTNGCTGYFPTEEEFDKGGYEVYWSMLDYFPYFGRVFPLNRESAQELIDAAVRGANPRGAESGRGSDGV